MRFVVLLHGDDKAWEQEDEAERAEKARRHEAFTAATRERGQVLAGEELSAVAAATTVRRRDGQVTVSEGPFAETVEQLGGFYLLDVPDLDTVLDLVAMLPEDTIEIRPVVDHGGS